MYLASYHFAGDAATLLAGYHHMMAAIPAGSVTLHVAISGPTGLTIYDACPDEMTFRAFSASPEFRDMVAAAGLPEPTIEALGVVEATVLSGVAT